jgi:hypothetical protein
MVEKHFRTMSNFSRLIALSLILVSLLSGSLSAQTLVLCVGDDRHAAFESASFGACDGGKVSPPLSTPPTNLLPAGSQLIEELHCGPCLDVLLSYELGSLRSRQSETPASIPAELPPIVTTAHLLLPHQLTSDPVLFAPTPRTPEPLLHHRTVVLLI